MNDTEESGYSLVVRFPDQSPSFARGVQTGVIWERLKYLEPGDTLREMIVSDLKEVLEDIARHERCDVIYQDTVDPSWVEVFYTKKPAFVPRIVK